MRAIARKDRKRKADDPFKATTYRLRKRTVPPQRIERYKKDHHITSETSISEAGMLKCIATFTLAKDDIGLATPSDLSCETPQSLMLSDSPTLTSPPMPYKPSNYSPLICSVGCEAWASINLGKWKTFDPKVLSAPISKTPPGLPLSLQLCDQMSNANPSLSVPLLVEYACCSVPELVELLQSLVTKLCGYGLVTYNADFYQHTIYYQHTICYQIMGFGNTDYEGPIEGRLPVPEAHGRLFKPDFDSWSNQLTNQLMDIYKHILDKNQNIDRIVARIDRFLAAICVEKNVITPLLQTVVDTADSYKLALGYRACGCRVCESLPQLLTFETVRRDVLSLLNMAPINHHYW